MKSGRVAIATVLLVAGCAKGPVGEGVEGVCLDFYRLQADGLRALLIEDVNGPAIWDLTMRGLTEMASDLGDADLIDALANLQTAGEGLQDGNPDADIFQAMRMVEVVCERHEQSAASD